MKSPQGHVMYGEEGCGLNEMGEMCNNRASVCIGAFADRVARLD